jgi:shikimate 5-dehydrogenase
VSAWEAASGGVLGGLELLVEQAVEQIRLFAPELEISDASDLRSVMLNAGRAELVSRNSSA